MKKAMAWMLIAMFLTSGCNTMNGLGKDVEKLGEKVQEKSNR